MTMIKNTCSGVRASVIGMRAKRYISHQPPSVYPAHFRLSQIPSAVSGNGAVFLFELRLAIEHACSAGR